MGQNQASLLPCPTCPWRVDRDATTIPNYVYEKACNLLNTVGPDDAFRPIMACHGEGVERACLGYLAKEGWSNLNVRLLLIKGEIEDPTAVLSYCDAAGISLESDYPTVLRKLARSVGRDEPEYKAV